MMIQKFRWRFIWMSILSLFIVLLFSTGGIVGLSFYRNNQEAHNVMATLVKGQGVLTTRDSNRLVGQKSNNFFAARPNPEAVFQYRYFTVSEGKNNKLTFISRPNQFDISPQKIQQKLNELKKLNIKSTYVKFDHNVYLLQKTYTNSGKAIYIFLNIDLIFSHSWVLLRTAILLVLASLLVFALILIALSKKAIGPIIETYKKQQSFITNAGHELKTPLAIISANTEMEEMMGNQNEWTKSTREQVDRLTNLINELIALARINEKTDLTLSTVNLSKVSEDVVSSFASIMHKQKLSFKTKIQKGIKIKAEEQTLGELLNIFLDNAQKYCDPDGTVYVRLNKSRFYNNAVLTIANSYQAGKDMDFNNFFDRFYRQDKSHNSKKSGFGIGLSMAQDIINKFGARIKVNYQNDMIFFVITFKVVKN